jgi:hypothetical protein
LKPENHEFFFALSGSHLDLALAISLQNNGFAPDVAPDECLNIIHADDFEKLLWINMSQEVVRAFGTDAAAVDALGIALAAFSPQLGTYAIVGFNQVGVGGLTSSTTTTTTTTSTTTTSTTTTQTTSTLTT